MIDLTEKFFTEIATSPKYTVKGIKKNPSEIKKFYGRCAVVSKRGRDKAKELKKFISDTGFSPVVLEFEEAKRLKGKADKKLQNLDILIMHKKDTPVHLFAGDENEKFQEFLGDNGILIYTKFSNNSMLPRVVLSILFNYILSTREYDYLFDNNNKDAFSNNLIYAPIDITNKLEYIDLLQKNSINPDDVHIVSLSSKNKNYHTESFDGLRVISLKQFQQSIYSNSQNDLDAENTIQFTVKSNKKFDKKSISLLEKNINNIYKDYDAEQFKSKVQIFSDK